MAPSKRSGSEPEPFPVRRVATVEARLPDTRWLVEPLWTAESVGIIAASPKQGKTWLAAELALAVATGGLALGRFPARQSGPVLFFGAEDDPSDLRARFDALAEVRGIDLEQVPLLLLDVAALTLSQPSQLARLRATIAAHAPRLLVLDPFVRIAQVDENSSAEVSVFLGALRALQREFALSIVLVHHMRKAPSRDLGQRLRGSSDFAAWHDSALFITADRDHKTLTVEHRRAPAPGPFALRLVDQPTPHLELLDDGDAPASRVATDDALQSEVLALLSASPVPLPTQDLRGALSRRKTVVIEALAALQAAGRVERRASGWMATAHAADPEVPSSSGTAQAELFPRSRP